MKKLKLDYEKSVEAIVNAFEKKHDIGCMDWVADDIGGVIECSDTFYSFNDIKYDIFNDVPVGVIEEWSEASLEAHYRKDKQINFSSYVKGARY